MTDFKSIYTLSVKSYQAIKRKEILLFPPISKILKRYLYSSIFAKDRIILDPRSQRTQYEINHWELPLKIPKEFVSPAIRWDEETRQWSSNSRADKNGFCKNSFTS